MQVKLAYGKTGLDVNLPDDANITLVAPQYVPALPDPADAVRRALQAPIGARPLREWAKPSSRVGIVFSDLTRPTPLQVLLPALRAELAHVPDENIVLFNGTGTHRTNTDAELRTMLGDEIPKRYRIVQNDSTDHPSHVCVGTTATGNAVLMHRDFVECDVRILTGFIEPHIFAGFSGGGKAVMPGLAHLETILRNHNARNLDDPRASWGVTDGNPVLDEVRAAVGMVEPVFLLNITLNRDKAITRIFAGDLTHAHAQGCAFVKQTAMRALPEPFDIVVTTNSGYPLDLNLYQSVKGMSAAKQICKRGGSIVMASQCWDGIPDHGEYANLLRDAQDLESLLQTVRAPGYAKCDQWEAQLHALILLHADVYMYSDYLTDAQLGWARLKRSRDIAATLAELCVRYGRDARICVLPEGPQTIPFIQ